MRYCNVVFLLFFIVNFFFVSYFISVEPLASLLQATATSNNHKRHEQK